MGKEIYKNCGPFFSYQVSKIKWLLVSNISELAKHCLEFSDLQNVCDVHLLFVLYA